MMELPQGPLARSIQGSTAHPGLGLPGMCIYQYTMCVLVGTAWYKGNAGKQRLFPFNLVGVLTMLFSFCSAHSAFALHHAHAPVQTVGKLEGVFARWITLSVLQLGFLQETGFSSLTQRANGDASCSAALARWYPELLPGVHTQGPGSGSLTSPPKRHYPAAQTPAFHFPRVHRDSKFLLNFSPFALYNQQRVFLFSSSILCRLEISGSDKAHPISDASGENEEGWDFFLPTKNSLLASVSYSLMALHEKQQ